MYAGPESKAGMVPLAPDLMYLLYIETPGGETPPQLDPGTLAPMFCASALMRSAGRSPSSVT